MVGSVVDLYWLLLVLVLADVGVGWLIGWLVCVGVGVGWSVAWLLQHQLWCSGSCHATVPTTLHWEDSFKYIPNTFEMLNKNTAAIPIEDMTIAGIILLIKSSDLHSD